MCHPGTRFMAVVKHMHPKALNATMLASIDANLGFTINLVDLHVLQATTPAEIVFRQERPTRGKVPPHHEDRHASGGTTLSSGFSHMQYNLSLVQFV